MARVLSLSEAKARLSELVANCEKDEEDLVITRNGRPAAVLMSADEYEGWRETREILRNRALMNEIKQGLRQLEKGHRRSSSSERIERRVDRAQKKDAGSRPLASEPNP